MKKVLKFLAYPLVAIMAVAVNAALFPLTIVGAISFGQTVSLIFYIFAGGIILNKINDKKIRNCSLIITALIMLAGGIACAAVMFGGSDGAVWAGMMVFPLANTVAGLFHEDYLNTKYLFVFIIGAVLPVLLSYLASLAFAVEKKKLKTVLIVVMVLIFSGSAIQSVVTIFKIADDSIYENGEFYNADFDINGNKYESYEEVPYYDRDGNVYYQTYNHPEKEYTDEEYYYIGEMTDENGNEYDIHDFYVYADGYIFMDKGNTVKMREDLPEDVMTDWYYVDSEGNICGSIIGVSYTRDGEPYFGMGNEYKEQ